MTPILGIMASQISGHLAVPNNFESIATTTLSTTAASITFSSIPATYKHLQIRMIARDTRSVTLEGYTVQFNGDTAGNYSDHTMWSDGANIGVFSNTSATFMSPYATASANATASVFGVSVIDILDYANTNKYKTIYSLNGINNNGSGAVGITSGNWRNTAAITSVTVGAQVGTWVAYSSFALYGIK